MEFYTFKKDLDKISELNTKFHEVIYNATKSRYLEHVLKDFQFFMKTTRYKSLRSTGRMESALDEHREVLNAFKDKDIDRAVKAILKHVNNSRVNAKRTGATT